MMDLFCRMGKKVIYVTNNAIYPTETNVAKLTRLGYKAEKVRIQEILDDTYVYMIITARQRVDNLTFISRMSVSYIF